MYFSWSFESRQNVGTHGQDICLEFRAGIASDDECNRYFFEHIVRLAYDSAFDDALDTIDHTLDFRCCHVFFTDSEHVFGAAHELELAIALYFDFIAGVEPSVMIEGCAGRVGTI